MDGEDLELFARSMQRRHEGPHGTCAGRWRSRTSRVDRGVDLRTACRHCDALRIPGCAQHHLVRPRPRASLHALGLDNKAEAGAVLPAIGQWDPPGVVNDRGLQVKGLAPERPRASTSPFSS